MELGRTTKDVIDEVTKYETNYNNSASTQGMLKRPSDETIRLLRKSETGLLYKQKYGDKAFRQKYRTPHDRRLSATEILETAIVDHTVVDTAWMPMSARIWRSRLLRQPIAVPTQGLPAHRHGADASQSPAIELQRLMAIKDCGLDVGGKKTDLHQHHRR